VCLSASTVAEHDARHLVLYLVCTRDSSAMCHISVVVLDAVLGTVSMYYMYLQPCCRYITEILSREPMVLEWQHSKYSCMWTTLVDIGDVTNGFTTTYITSAMHQRCMALSVVQHCQMQRWYITDVTDTVARHQGYRVTSLLDTRCPEHTTWVSWILTVECSSVSVYLDYR